MLEPPWPVLDQLGANLMPTQTQLGAKLRPTWPSLGPTWGQVGASSNELLLVVSGHVLSALGASPMLHFGLHCRISVRRTLDSSKLRLMLATSGQFWSLLDGYAFSGRLPRLVLAAFDRVWADSGLTLHAHGSTYACILHTCSHDACFWPHAASFGQYRRSDRAWPSAEKEPVTERPGHK